MLDKIDYSKEYRIEAIPSRDIKEFSEKGIGTYPGINQSFSVSWNDMLKKCENTGFDENAKHILQITDVEKRKDIQDTIVKNREHFESLLGMEGSLKPHSDLWLGEIGRVHVQVGQDLRIRVNGNGSNVLRPASNYRDAIALTILLNNPNFPKSKADISNPKYVNSKFYITTKDELSSITKGDKQKTKRGWVEIEKLFASGKNKTRPFEVAYALGVMGYGEEDLEKVESTLTDVIFDDKTKKTLDKFLEICEMDNTVLSARNMFQLGIEFGIIGVNKDGYYRGKTNYRQTISESVDLLLSPGSEVELAGLREAVNKAKKKYNVSF